MVYVLICKIEVLITPPTSFDWYEMKFVNAFHKLRKPHSNEKGMEPPMGGKLFLMQCNSKLSGLLLLKQNSHWDEHTKKIW